MKKQIIISLFLTMASICYAQKADSIAFLQKNQETGIATDGSLLKYRRSSLYSVIIEHPTFPYGEQIDSAFLRCLCQINLMIITLEKELLSPMRLK